MVPREREHAMSDVTMRSDFAPPGPYDLRARIGWICHVLRIGAAVWVAWVLVFAAVHWSNKPAILEAYGTLFAMDLTDISIARYAMAVLVVAIACIAPAAVAFCIWRLFSTYLSGRVFVMDAAMWLRRTAFAGL